MRAGEFGAARFLDGRKFHEFDAGGIGVVEIELPFAVAADLGLFGEFDASFHDLCLDGVDVGDAKRDVIHDAACAFIGGGRDVEHVFDPVGAIGNLHGDPTGFVVLHAAVPVEMEAENILVEVIGGGAVVDDEAGVNDANGIGRVRRGQAGA